MKQEGGEKNNRYVRCLENVRREKIE